MSGNSNGLVQKLWNYCNILRDDGLSYGDYVEQLTFLLFLKMADEQSKPPGYTCLAMRSKLAITLLVIFGSLSAANYSTAKSIPQIAAEQEAAESNYFGTVRTEARKIILKIDSIRLSTYQPLWAMHTGSIESLKTIAVMDYEYWKKEAWRDGHGTVKLTPQNLTDNRKIRERALAEYRASAKNVLEEWQKMVDAVSMTESAVGLLDHVDGLDSEAAALRQMLPAWLAIRDDLKTAIAIARGKQDSVPDNPSTHEPQTGHLAARLASGIKSPVDALRSQWDRISLMAANLSEKARAASSPPLSLSPEFTTQPATTTSSSMDSSQIVSISIGFFLILLLLTLVFWRRNLTEAEYTFARIVLALAVACVAVVLTGFLNVNFKGAIQAGGAFAVFVIVYNLSPAKLHGSSEWQRIRSLWRDRYDLHDDPVSANQNAVVSSIDAINQAARMISDDESLFRPFRQDYGDDFCRLYRQLTNNKYLVTSANSTSDLLLTNATRRLASRIPCTA